MAVTAIYNWKVHNSIISIGSLITHISATHGLFPQYISDTIAQSWSISIEIMFYLLVPFIIKWLGENLDKYIKAIAIISLLLYPVNIVGDKILSSYFPGADGSFCYLWLPNQIIPFLVGMSLYLIIIKNKTISNWKGLSVYLLMIVAILFFSLSQVLTVSLIEAVLFIVMSKYSNKIFNNKFFHFVGKVSYGIYLFHILVIFAMQDTGLLSINSMLSLVLYFVAVPIASILIGTITYYAVEKPALNLERKIEKKLKNKQG